MSNSLNRKEFLQNLGTLSVAAGTGSFFTGLDPSDSEESNAKIYVSDTNQQKIKIYNGKIITPYRIIDGGTVVVTGDKISEVSEGNVEVSGAKEINAQGKYISPGFVDLHCHGAGGHDFLDGSVDAFLGAAEMKAKHGTTSMFPTALSGDKQVLFNNIDLYRKADEKNENGTQFLGLFLEGPYYSMDHKGAQDPRFIRDPDPQEYKEIIEYSPEIKRWDSAPEKEGAMDFGRYLVSKGVIPSLGHTDAIYDDVIEAYENGFQIVTHLYSTMNQVTRRQAFRYAGAVEAAYLIDGLFVEVIADARHLPPTLLQLIYKIKGPDRICLVTDSMRAAGEPPGEYILGPKDDGLRVIVEDGVAKLPDRTSFAGSVATADRCVRNMINKAGVPLDEAVQMASSTPAIAMQVDDRKGSLRAGKDADIIIFDENINVEKTIIGGRLIYEQST